MNLDILQRERDEWANKKYGAQTTDTLLAGLIEELGELCSVYVRAKNGEYDAEEIRTLTIDAVGDIVVYLAGYCSATGIRLEDSVSATWEHVKDRNNFVASDPCEGCNSPSGSFCRGCMYGRK